MKIDREVRWIFNYLPVGFPFSTNTGFVILKKAVWLAVRVQFVRAVFGGGFLPVDMVTVPFSIRLDRFDRRYYASFTHRSLEGFDDLVSVHIAFLAGVTSSFQSGKIISRFVVRRMSKPAQIVVVWRVFYA
jgi:hypothetical protein